MTTIANVFTIASDDLIVTVAGWPFASLALIALFNVAADPALRDQFL